MFSTRNYGAPERAHGEGKYKAAQPQPLTFISKKFQDCVEVLCTDAVGYEMAASREQQDDRDVFKNVKLVMKDATHAASRVMARSATAEPATNDVLELLTSKCSVTHLIQHRPAFKCVFTRNINAMDDNPAEASALRARDLAANQRQPRTEHRTCRYGTLSCKGSRFGA